MKVSVIIPTMNRRDIVLRTVDSVLQQDYPAPEYEIIVIVDGATDGTAGALHSFDTESRLRIIEQVNRGLPGARNSGFRIAEGELLIFLDDDMICTQGWLRAHVTAHEAKSYDEIVGLGAIYVSADHPISLAAEMFSTGQGAEFLLHRDFPEEPWPENVWSFANTSISRELLQRLGGFDERFRMREDGELGVRLLKVGVRQQFIANAVAHQWCEKSAEELVRDAEAFAQYDLLFLETHPGWTPHNFFAHLQQESRWKRAARQVLARHLSLADPFLAPLSAMGEWRHTPSALRKLALRVLLLRCGLHWYRRMVEIAGSVPTGAAASES